MRRLLILGAALAGLFAFTAVASAQFSFNNAWFFGNCEPDEEEVNATLLGGTGCRGFGIFFGEFNAQSMADAIEEEAFDEFGTDVVVVKLSAFRVGAGTQFVQPVRGAYPDFGECLLVIEENGVVESDQLAGFGGLWIAWFQVEVCSPAPFLGGEASIVEGNGGGNGVQLLSDDTAPTAFSFIRFPVQGGLTFADISVLSTDFNPTDDGCVGGSPRFQISVDTDDDGDHDGNIFVYLGPNPTSPPGSPCVPSVWNSSGNLLANGLNVDTSQLGALGTFYHEYSAAVAAFGDAVVLSISLAVDASWASAGEQTTVVDNTNINGTIHTYD